MERALETKVALVTGPSSGLGRAVALALGARGAKLVVSARRSERLAALCEELSSRGAESVFCAGDGSVEETARAAVELSMQKFGRIDILINNAGAAIYKPFVETSTDEMELLISANLRTSLLFTRHVLPHMITQGSGVIYFISSVAGLIGPANEAVYAATKFAQTGLAQSPDAEYRRTGIKVGVIHPAGMKTELALGTGRDTAGVAASCMMDPVEVAEIVAYVCSLPAGIRTPQLTVRHMG